jgi:hypothetical protein
MTTDVTKQKFEEIQKFLRSHLYEKYGRVKGNISNRNLSLMFEIKGSKEYDFYTCYLYVKHEQPTFNIIFPGVPCEYYNFKCHNGNELTDKNIHVYLSIYDEDYKLHKTGETDLNDIIKVLKKKFMVK